MQKLSIFVLSIVATGALFWSSAQAQQAPAPGAQNPPAKASSQAPAKGPGTAKSGQASSRQTPAALTLNTPKDKLDRKSTRLNSSHGYISYAVFCLKKKKKKKKQ